MGNSISCFSSAPEPEFKGHQGIIKPLAAQDAKQECAKPTPSKPTENVSGNINGQQFSGDSAAKHLEVAEPPSKLPLQSEGAPLVSPKKTTEGSNNSDAVDPNSVVLENGAFMTASDDVLAAQLEIENGLPYKVQCLGPPPPPCDEKRLSTVDAISSVHPELYSADVEAPADPELTSILKLVSSIFNAPACLVALFGDKKIFVRDATGVFQRGDFPWRYSFCGWTMASKNDQIMVIPDATRDARFSSNKFVTSAPGVRFYCGTPLLASNGHRLGTLCFADFTPRTFDASNCMILSNLAEMVVRHVEKDIALQLRTQDNQALTAMYGQLKRTLDAFENCVMVVDTRENEWKIAYTNLAWKKLTSLERDAVLQQPIANVFRGVDGQPLPWSRYVESVRQNKEFTIPKAEILPSFFEAAGGPGSNASATSASSSARAKRFVLKFRPANSEELDDQALPIGVPAYIPAAPTGTQSGLYFCSIEDYELLSKNIKSSSSLASQRSKNFWNEPPESIKGLEMGHLLGKGSFGSVYFAKWFGSPVAVKVLENPGSSEDPSQLPEVALGLDLRHPHIVGVLKCASKTVVVQSAVNSSYSGPNSTAGSLNDHNFGSSNSSSGGGYGYGYGSANTPTARVSSKGQQQGLITGGLVTGASANSSSNLGCSLSKPSTDGTPTGASMTFAGNLAAVPEEGSSCDSAAGYLGEGVSTATNAAVDSSSSSSSAAAVSAAALEVVDCRSGSEGKTPSNNPPSEGARWAVIHLPPGGDGHHGIEGEEDEDGSHFSSSSICSSSGAGNLGFRHEMMTYSSSMNSGPGNGPGSSAYASNGGRVTRTWIIMEYCDRGSLQDAIDRGWLRVGGNLAQADEAAGAYGKSCIRPISPASLDSATSNNNSNTSNLFSSAAVAAGGGCGGDSTASNSLVSLGVPFPTTKPSMPAILATSVEIASALAFLHSRGIIHGDLSAWNVMLASSDMRAAGGGRDFKAKIADFGLSRLLDVRTRIQTKTYGTLTHMPVELLRDGTLGSFTDVYSFGVLMWQMYTSSRPWGGMTHGQIIMMKVTGKGVLKFPIGTPLAYEDLACRCMATDFADRPPITEVVAVLENLFENAEGTA